jgi:hypothetical protein
LVGEGVEEIALARIISGGVGSSVFKGVGVSDKDISGVVESIKVGDS